MNTLVMFLSVRVLHVLFGAIWLGVAVFISYFLLPALQNAGPDGGKVMIALGARVNVFIASVAGLTVLSGLWLYWRFTDGFDPGISSTMAGRVFGTGGLLGLVAAVIGGSVVGRNMKKAVNLLTEAGAQPEGPSRGALVERALGARRTAATAVRLVTVLLIVTIVLMALGHYV